MSDNGAFRAATGDVGKQLNERQVLSCWLVLGQCRRPINDSSIDKDGPKQSSRGVKARGFNSTTPHRHRPAYRVLLHGAKDRWEKLKLQYVMKSCTTNVF